MTVRFKKTDKGEVAILPRKEYEMLVAKAKEADEDAGTARLVARARKEIAAGAPLIPMAVADRIAKGENPIRAIRDWKDVTQLYLSSKGLAKLVSMSPGEMSLSLSPANSRGYILVRFEGSKSLPFKCSMSGAFEVELAAQHLQAERGLVATGLGPAQVKVER